MSEESLEEKLNEHLKVVARDKLIFIDAELEALRDECLEIYIQTGSVRAKLLAEKIKELEEDQPCTMKKLSH